MRLWSLHPRYLDRAGLTACWREALLAQAVLAGRTKGYTAHPQLDRFRAHADPLAAVGAYLEGVRAEAERRGYRFDGARIDERGEGPSITVTDGQLRFERAHLDAKLAVRAAYLRAFLPELPEPHPLFVRVPGGVEPWERATSAAADERPERGALT